MAAPIVGFFNLLVVVAFIASLTLWTRLLLRHKSDPSLSLSSVLPAESRLRPFWTPADFLIMFAMVFVLAIVFALVFSSGGQTASAVDSSPTPTVESLLSMLILNSLAGGGALLIVLGWLRLCYPKALEELQLMPTLRDLKLGLLASLYLLPPVMLIAGAVSNFVPYEHKVLETLTKSPTPGLFSLLFFCTAILTPVIEEFMFRVLLQGGIQGMVDRSEAEDGTWRPITYWPIVFTSVFFAMMHYGQGAAPIPLFFLSLGLGYLYRQTGSMTAPVVVHMMLNGVTLCAAFGQAQL